MSRAEWERAWAELLPAEKAAPLAKDAVAAHRKWLPMVMFRSDYAFSTPRGVASLLDLFGGQNQLLVYQFMDTGSKPICSGYTWVTDGIPVVALTHLAAPVSTLGHPPSVPHWLEPQFRFELEV